MSVVVLILSSALASGDKNPGYDVAPFGQDLQENSGHHIAKREPTTLTTLGTLFTTITGFLTTVAPFVVIGKNHSHMTLA